MGPKEAVHKVFLHEGDDTPESVKELTFQSTGIQVSEHKNPVFREVTSL